MAVLPIITLPDPLLRKKSAPVERIDEGIRKLAADMLETMYAAPGVGLAAVQVLLYAGGVVTIVVFAIMLTERLVGDSVRQTNRGILAGAATAAAVFVGLVSTQACTHPSRDPCSSKAASSRRAMPRR